MTNGSGLTGRVALVTGGSGGLGSAMCVALAAAGAAVAVHGRDEERMRLGALVVRHLKRDGIVDQRAYAVADVTAQAIEVQACLLVNQHRDTQHDSHHGQQRNYRNHRSLGFQVFERKKKRKG